MDKNFIDNIKNNQSLEDAINDSVPHEVKILKDLNEKKKSDKEELYNFLIDGDFYRIKTLKQQYKKDKKNETVKEELKEAKAKMNRTFREVSKIISSSNTEGLQKLVDKLSSIVQMLRYIGNPVLDDLLRNVGISLNMNALESDYEYFKDTSIQDGVKGCWDLVKETSKDVEYEQKKILDYYECIDNELKYSQDNKKGLKPSQFESLVKTKAAKQVYGDATFEKFVKKEDEKNREAITRSEIMIAKNEDL